MANPVNGTGKGGKSFQDRELAARVRSLTLQECEKALLKKKGKLYQAVLLKLAGTVLPRLNEHTGEGGGPVEVGVIYLPKRENSVETKRRSAK